MAEKVIHEMRLIETDDGFRIEIKGDKQRLKRMFFHPGMMFGPRPGFGRRAHRAWRGHGRGFAHPWMPGWWEEESEGESEDAPSEEA